MCVSCIVLYNALLNYENIEIFTFSTSSNTIFNREKTPTKNQQQQTHNKTKQTTTKCTGIIYSLVCRHTRKSKLERDKKKSV